MQGAPAHVKLLSHALDADVAGQVDREQVANATAQRRNTRDALKRRSSRSDTPSDSVVVRGADCKRSV